MIGLNNKVLILIVIIICISTFSFSFAQSDIDLGSKEIDYNLIDAPGENEEVTTFSYLKLFASFVFLLLILGIIYYWILKNKKNDASFRDTHVLKTIGIGDGVNIKFLAINDILYLVALSENSIELIDKLDDEQFIQSVKLESSNSELSGFKGILKKEVMRLDALKK